MRLSQVITNLLNNAAKYTDVGGHIWLTVQQVRDAVEISVRDTGVGIPIYLRGQSISEDGRKSISKLSCPR